MSTSGCRRKKGSAIRMAERELLRTIVNECDRESRNHCLSHPLHQATKRAANYAHVSERTVKRIREEIKLNGRDIVVGRRDHMCSYARLAKRAKMTYKFASNLSFMFQEAPAIIDRYQLAKDSGFGAVESGFPVGFTVNQVVEAKQKANIEQILINVFTGDTAKGELGFAALPGKEQEFKDSISLTLEYAKALNCKKIHIMSGIVANPTSANDSAYINNLKYAAGQFEALGIVGVIEPINSITVPNYYMNNYEKALEIIKKINSPSLKLQLDFFHLQQITGRITNTFEKCLPHIGHIQIAQVPDRNEPDTLGEIDYHYIFSLLDKHKYSGYVGLEYKPRAGSSEGLKWLSRFGLQL